MKEYILIISLFLAFCIQSAGQDSVGFFLDEFQISLNRTTLQDDNTEDRFGIGLGAYHSFLADKRINILFGLEYNRTNQFKKDMYEGHFATATNVTYNLNCVSIPVGARLHVGNKLKLFAEVGGFADLMINSQRKGTMHTYLPDENYLITYSQADFKTNAGLSNSYGFYFGLGVRVPLSKFELIVKPEYKCSLNELYSYQDNIYSKYFKMNVGLKL